MNLADHIKEFNEGDPLEAVFAIMDATGIPKVDGAYTDEAFLKAADMILRAGELSIEETVWSMSKGEVIRAAQILQELDQCDDVSARILEEGSTWIDYLRKAEEIQANNNNK